MRYQLLSVINTSKNLTKGLRLLLVLYPGSLLIGIAEPNNRRLVSSTSNTSFKVVKSKPSAKHLKGKIEMATATEATSGVGIITNNETYRVYVKLDSEGKIQPKETKIVTAGKDNKTWADLDADKSYTLAIEQTVREYKAGSWDAIASLIPDEDERLVIFNSGLNAKSDRKLKAELSEIDDAGTNLTFEPSDLYDTLDLIQEPTQRRNLTPVEKATRQIRTAVKAMFPTFSDEQVEAQVRSMLSTMQNAGEVEQS